MIEILKKMFKAQPEKSTIVLKEKCLDCGRDSIIEITLTSGGLGLQGGALCECSPDEYFVRCPNCYKVNPKTKELSWQIGLVN